MTFGQSTGIKSEQGLPAIGQNVPEFSFTAADAAPADAHNLTSLTLQNKNMYRSMSSAVTDILTQGAGKARKVTAIQAAVRPAVGLSFPSIDASAAQSGALTLAGPEGVGERVRTETLAAAGGYSGVIAALDLILFTINQFGSMATSVIGKTISNRPGCFIANRQAFYRRSSGQWAFKCPMPVHTSPTYYSAGVQHQFKGVPVEVAGIVTSHQGLDATTSTRTRRENQLMMIML